MNRFRFLTAGESHGKCLNAIVEGMPANIDIDFEFINFELARRQGGYGRGGRMKIETDKATINSGVRFGKTTGAPICIEIKNKDWENWTVPMSVSPLDLTDNDIVQKINEKKITRVRPGHADLSGAIKYNQDDIRNILERSSARETAARVGVGAIAKCLLKQFNVEITSCVLNVGVATTKEEIKTIIDEAQKNGDTLGGEFEIRFKNLPTGLGSFVHWDRRLDGQLAQALMSIQAIKAVEIGAGTKVAQLTGSQTHDEIFYQNNQFQRKTNNAGGIEGGMTNGEDVVIRATMKAIPTMKKPLQSVDYLTKEPYNAHFERSDTCAVDACAVVGEAMASIVIANAFLEKFGGDSLEELKRNYDSYIQK